MTLRLFILKPPVIFQGRINEPSAVTYPVRQFQYDGVAVGTYSLVDYNMTVLFGSTQGGDDLGRQRVRLYPDSDTMYIGLSSQGSRDGEVVLTDNAWFSVLEEYRVWGKTPRIDPDGTIYKDADIAYVDQNDEPDPVANGGTAFCGTIDPITEVITVTLSASTSFTTASGATIVSYFWNVDDGSITVGTDTSATITVEFPGGFRYVNLVVADSNGNSHRCHVPIFARDPDDDDSISNFTIERHTITPEGQELTVRIRQSIDESEYIDGTLVMLFEEPSGPTDRTNVLFQGYIETEPATISAEPTATLRDVVLNCVDVAGRLKQLPGFSQVVERVASPDKWTEATDPNIDFFLWYLLSHHTTALDLTDFTWSGVGSSYPFTVLSSDGSSLWEQVSRRAESMVPEYKLTCNRQGRLRVIVDPMLLDTGSRTSTVQATLDAGDYRDIGYTHQRNSRYHWLRSNAIVASTTTVAAVFCIAPGNAPSQGTTAMDDGENLTVSQATLNAYAGHKYARLNAPQGLFSMTLAEGSTQSIQPADLTWVRLTISSTVAAQRGLAFTNERGLVHSLDIRYQSTRTALIRTVSLQWERETVKTADAITVTIPAATPVDDGDWNAPPLVIEEQFNNGLTGGDVLAFIDEDGMIFTTSNFTAATPTWAKNSSAVGAVGPLTLKGFVVDPFSPGYRGLGTAINAWVVSNTALWRITDIFGTPAYTSEFTWADSIASSGEHGSIAASFGRFFPVEADNPWVMGAHSYRNSGAGQNGIYIKYSDDAGAAWSSEIQPSGIVQTITTNQGTAYVGLWLSPRTPGLGLIGAYSVTGTTPTGSIYKTTDWGATWSLADSEYGATMGVGLGGCFHVPWENNLNEEILYYGYWDRASSVFNYRLYRSEGGSSTDISPTVSAVKYGPLRNNFGIRSLDTDRQQMVLIGFGNNSDRIDPGASGSDALVGVFVSSDGGDTWTLRGSTVACTVNGDWPYFAAFASGDANKIYVAGNDGYIAYSTNAGVSFTDKQPTNIAGSSVEILGICGGPL